MNNLITKTEDGKPALTYSLSNRIVWLMQQQDELKKIQDELKANLIIAMKEAGVKKLENDELTITYIEPTYSERFDSKALKAASEETYNQYVKLTPVTESIRMKAK